MTVTVDADGLVGLSGAVLLTETAAVVGLDRELSGLLHSPGPGGGGQARPRKLAGCVDLEPWAGTPTGRRLPGSGFHRR
jgi:hypothetical protein